MPKIVPRPAIVYCAVNIQTGDRYIGFTTRRLQDRITHHFAYARRRGATTVFSAALRRFGRDGFKWHVLERFTSGVDASEFERQCIKYLNPEYNGTSGGVAYRPKTTSDAEREQLRMRAAANKEKWRIYAAQGPAAMARPVICLSTGRSFRSASAAARAYGLKKSSVIEVCRRHPRRRSAGGKIFRYIDDTDLQENADLLLQSARRNCSNPYQGVHRHVLEGKDTGRWRARISCGGRKAPVRYSVGIFATAEEARDAYLKARSDLKKGRRPKWLRDHTPRERRQIQTMVHGVAAIVAVS